MSLRTLGAIAAAGLIAAVLVMAPWATPSPITYESVSGWPMRVHYRNQGNGPERVSAVGGLPALGVEEPLSAQQIDEYFALVKQTVKPAPTLVKSGDFMWFEIDDPDRLAWVESQTERQTWFYVFAVVEMPRSALVNTKWVSELCLVAKRAEPFKRCAEHNAVYAGS